MALLERRTQLAELGSAWRDAAAGRGSVVAVVGEAGVGKTALLQEFSAAVAPSARWGMCDALVTPRPLGPFRDMFPGFGIEDVGTYCEAILEELSAPPHPTLAFIEDAHWADQTTLDAVRFIGRRVGRLRALLVLSYRDDEVPAGHPLRVALGAVPASDTRRVQLSRLSREAVAVLVRDWSNGALSGRGVAGPGGVGPGGVGPDIDIDIDDLYALTRGNPFFVREVLAASSSTMPPTIQDAVMARVGRVGDKARSCIEIASVVPGRAERTLLERCGVGDGLDDAQRSGVLTEMPGGMVAFGNELARRAVESVLTPARRRAANALVLQALVTAGDADAVRLAHHAVQAEDPVAVATYAPAAAVEAASMEEHRAAAQHYVQALRHPDQLGAERRSDLLEAYARECRVTGQHDDGLGAVDDVLAGCAESGDDARRGRNLVLKAELMILSGRRLDAEEVVASAIETLADRPPGQSLAAAYALRARLAMMSGRPDEAISWGERARATGMDPDEAEANAHLDVTVSTARWQLDPDADRGLVDSARNAWAAGVTYPAARAHVNLAYGNVMLMRYTQAEARIAEGLAFCEEYDHVLDSWYILSCRAMCRFETGRWEEAERDIDLLAESAPGVRQSGLWLRALLYARRGDARATEAVASLREVSEAAGRQVAELRTLAAQAELAYLTRAEPPAADLRKMKELIAIPRAWSRGADDAALFLARAGLIDSAPDWVCEPRARHIAGQWSKAATGWAELGRPYDQADALADADEPGPLFEALDILDRLGASARAAMVRDKLSEMGVARVPRGPRLSTRMNPAGLTARQVEILRMLADGLTFPKIAERMHVAVKTVDNHVAAVRAKLGVSNRWEAVDEGRRLGIVGPESGDGASQ